MHVKNKQWLKTTLLLSSMMTMMAGAVVAPSLPQINNIFSQTPNADILTRLIITLPALFIAFMSPIFGKISDVYGRKKILVPSLLLYALSGSSGYLANSLYLLLLGRVFLGISVAGIMTMVIALVGDYFKGKERAQFLGVQGAFMGVGGVVFIALAGVLADVGWQVPFLIYLFGFIVLPLSLIYIADLNFNRKQSIGKEATIHIEYSKNLVGIIYSLIFIGIIAFYMIPVQIPYLLKSLNEISNSQVGLAISLQSLSGAMVAMNYRKIKARISFCAMYQITFAIMALGYFIIGLSSTYFHYILGLLVSGLGVGMLMPTGNMWIIEVAPEAIRGKLVGRANTATFIAMFLSPVIIQPIIHYCSISAAFWIMALLLLLVIFGLNYLKQHSQRLIGQNICYSNDRNRKRDYK